LRYRQIIECERRGHLTLVLICLCLVGSRTALTAGEFDGTYTGTFVILPWSHPICGPLTPKIVIVDVKLTYAHTASIGTLAIVITDVSSDGSFHGTAPRLQRPGEEVQNLTGTVTVSGIEADTWTPRCMYHLSLKKS
jgi:hypothetical protein